MQQNGVPRLDGRIISHYSPPEIWICPLLYNRRKEDLPTKKKKGIYEVKPPRKATQDKLELYSRYLAVASQTNSSMQKEERKQSSAKSIGPQTPKKLHSIKYEKTYNEVIDGLPIPHHTNTSNTN